MKIIFFAICLSIIGSSFSQTNTSKIYFIHISKGDHFFKKQVSPKYISVDYVCQCYAGKNNLNFSFRDGDQNYIRDTLPTKTITMQQFIDEMNGLWSLHKERKIWQDQVILIEELENKKYNYLRVKFFPDPHEE